MEIEQTNKINSKNSSPLAAKLSTANAVKFQTFKAKNLVTPQTPKAEYQKKNTSKNENHYEMIKSLEML